MIFALHSPTFPLIGGVGFVYMVCEPFVGVCSSSVWSRMVPDDIQVPSLRPSFLFIYFFHFSFFSFIFQVQHFPYSLSPLLPPKREEFFPFVIFWMSWFNWGPSHSSESLLILLNNNWFFPSFLFPFPSSCLLPPSPSFFSF